MGHGCSRDPSELGPKYDLGGSVACRIDIGT